MKIRNFLIPKKLQALRTELKEKGVKKFVMEMGWKVVLGVFLYYLIRDSILYILIPYLIAKGILAGN
jgi:hypothetical protein